MHVNNSFSIIYVQIYNLFVAFCKRKLTNFLSFNSDIDEI